MILLKYFIIVFCSLYLFIKIMNYSEISFVKVLLSVFLSASLTLLNIFDNAVLPLMVKNMTALVVMIVFIGVVGKIKIEILIPASIISYGVSSGLYFVSSAIPFFIVKYIFHAEMILITEILIFVVNFALIFLIFRIKRLRNGFIFLQEEESGGAGVIISGIILLLFTGPILPDISNLIMSLIISVAAICIMVIIFWWRSRITRLYRESLREKELQDTKEALSLKEKEYEELMKQHNVLASTVHRDNKLLPALIDSVKRFAELYGTTHEECAELLTMLTNMMDERMGAIEDSQREYKELPLTGVPLIDSTLNFMYKKAAGRHVEFDLILTASVKFMVEKVINESMLQTIIADFIENAIIATSPCDYKNILVTIGIVDQCYELSIKDSGIAFEPETLFKLGLEKTTTHANNGGSGIGLKTVFEILAQTEASLLITEYFEQPHNFSKCITVRFDNKRHYTIESHRANDLQAQCTREDCAIRDLRA